MQALEHDAKKGGNKRIVALGHIVAMQKLLQAYRAEEIQKLSYSSWAVGSKPTLITQEIDPALKRITKALKNLKVSTSEYSVAAIAAGSIVALVSATAVGLWLAGHERRANLWYSMKPASRTTTFGPYINQDDYSDEILAAAQAAVAESDKVIARYHQKKQRDSEMRFDALAQDANPDRASIGDAFNPEHNRRHFFSNYPEKARDIYREYFDEIQAEDDSERLPALDEVQVKSRQEYLARADKLARDWLRANSVVAD